MRCPRAHVDVQMPPWCIPGASSVHPRCILGASLVHPRCILAPLDLVPGSILDLQVRNLSLPRFVLDPKVCNLSHLRTNLHQLWTNLSQLKMNFGELRANLSLTCAILAPYKAQEPLKIIVFSLVFVCFSDVGPQCNFKTVCTHLTSIWCQFRPPLPPTRANFR